MVNKLIGILAVLAAIVVSLVALPAPSANAATVSATYMTYDAVKGKWLPEVVDQTDYAGNLGNAVSGVAIKISGGYHVTYMAHQINGSRWLPAVTGYNTADTTNGFAGNLGGNAIDALAVKTDAPQQVTYRVHIKGGNWLPTVTGYNTADSRNGYAGNIGQTIDAVQVWFAGTAPVTPPPTPTPVPVTSVSPTKTSVTLSVGQSVGVAGTVAPSNATDKTLTWTSTAPGIAAVGTMLAPIYGSMTVQSGVTVYIWGLSPGTATVTARSASGKTASVSVFVYKRYVALGDSYATGLGVTSAEPVSYTNPVWTWPFDSSEKRWSVVNQDNCYRTTMGYPRLLANNSSGYVRLADTDWLACQGAMMADIVPASLLTADDKVAFHPNNPLQYLSLDATVNVVTLSIGGNRMGLDTIAAACATAPFTAPACDKALSDAKTAVTSPNFVTDLARVYTQVVNRASKAQVYIVGYANPFKAGSADMCLWNPYNGSKSQAQAALALINSLNESVNNAVKSVQNPRLHYVNANPVPTAGFPVHTLCDTQPWIRRLPATLLPAQFARWHGTTVFPYLHPTVDGNIEYYRLLAGI